MSEKSSCLPTLQGAYRKSDRMRHGQVSNPRIKKKIRPLNLGSPPSYPSSYRWHALHCTAHRHGRTETRTRRGLCSTYTILLWKRGRDSQITIGALAQADGNKKSTAIAFCYYNPAAILLWKVDWACWLLV